MQVLAGRVVVVQAYLGQVIGIAEASRASEEGERVSGCQLASGSEAGGALRETEKRAKRKKTNFAWGILLWEC